MVSLAAQPGQVLMFHTDTKTTYTKLEEIAARGQFALDHVRAAKPDVVVTPDHKAAIRH